MPINKAFCAGNTFFDGGMGGFYVLISRQAYVTTPRPAQAALHAEYSDAIANAIAVKFFNVDQLAVGFHRVILCRSPQLEAAFAHDSSQVPALQESDVVGALIRRRIGATQKAHASLHLPQ